jgi:upstream activation factor subunit UAF30
VLQNEDYTHDTDKFCLQDAINALIGERFDIARAKAESDPEQQDKSSSDSPSETTNGNHDYIPPPAKTNGTLKRSASSDDSAPPPAKKPKAVKPARTSAKETDAELAARLQAEENRSARSTRGGGVTKRKAPLKKEKAKKKKMKSKTKIGSDDDSIGGSGDDEEKKVKRNGGFHVSSAKVYILLNSVLTQKQKPMALSEPLYRLLGESTLSRPQTVKKIWEYIKENDLQDPEDKRQIRCDAAMRSVFKQDKVHMFTMNKILSQNLYPVENTIET